MLTDYTERRGGATAERVMKAVRLDPYFYASVAEDDDRTREAVVVAALSSLTMGLGLMLMRIVEPIWWLLGGLAWAAFLVGAGSWFLVEAGRRLGGSGEHGQMRRALGYAMAPQALGFIPIADFIPGFAIGVVWSTACAVVAVREVHGVPTRLAGALVVAPILVIIAIAPLVGVALAGNG
jgi:hypothetical protein